MLEGLLPRIVVPGPGRVILDPEQFTAQAEEGAVGVRVVDAEAALRHREVGVELGEGAGQTGVAEGAHGGLRLVAAEVAQRPGGDDVGDGLLPRGGAEQAGFVVVALGGEVGVTAGKVIQGAVLLQRLVPEGAEGQVLGSVAIDASRRPLAETLAVSQQVLAFHQHVAQGLVAALVVGGELRQFEVGREQFAVKLLKLIDLLFLLVGEIHGLNLTFVVKSRCQDLIIRGTGT